MFALIRQLEESRASTTQEKVSIWTAIKRVYRSWQGKRKYEALKNAKRIEKAALRASNLSRALELEQEADDLILQSVGMKDRMAIEKIMDEATAKMIEATSLRQVQ